MILRTLHLRRFGRFIDSEWEFAAGLTVIRGPNEAGKSTMREAIARLLLPENRVHYDNDEIRRWITWGRDQRSVLECSFDARGDRYELLRDFESERAELRCPGSGEVITDEPAVAERMFELLGIASRDVYETTACLAQQEFVRLQAGEKVAQLLQQTVVGAGGETGAQEVLDELDSELGSLNRGLTRHAKNPGPVRSLLDRIEKLSQKIGHLRPITEAAVEAQDAIERARDRMTEIDEELAQAQRIRERAEERRELEEELAAVSEDFQELDARARKARDLQQRIAAIDERLSDLPKITREQTEKLAKLVDEAKLAAEAIPEMAAKAEDAASKAQEALDEIEAAEGQVPDEELVDRARDLERDIEATRKDVEEARTGLERAEEDLEAARAAGRAQRSWIAAAGALVVAGAGLALGLGQMWPWIIAAVGLVAGVLGATRGPRIAVEEAEQRRDDAAAKLERLREETQQIEEELAKLLHTANAADVDALVECRRDARETLETAREVHAAAKAVAADAAEQAERAEQQAEIAQARLEHELEELGADTEEEFFQAAREVFDLREERERLVSELDGTLGDRDLSEIEEMLSELSSDRMGLRQKLDSEEMAFAELDAESFEELISRIESLQAEREQLQKRIQQSQGAANHPDADPERLRRLEEQRAAAEERLERVRERRDAIQLAHELLTEAHEQTLEGAIDVLEPRTSELLGRITGGRYCRVQFDHSTLAPRVHSDEKGQPVDPDRELSCATREQVYLAARLALTHLLWPDECPPIMLDDPFVNFDPVRRCEAVEMVQDVARTHQVLLFTCNDLYDAAADRVVELPSPQTMLS